MIVGVLVIIQWHYPLDFKNVYFTVNTGPKNKTRGRQPWNALFLENDALCPAVEPLLEQFLLNVTPSLHFTSLHFTSLHFTSLHFTSLHFTSLHFTSLHFTSLHFHFTLLSLKRICILQLMITSKIYGMVSTKCK